MKYNLPNISGEYKLNFSLKELSFLKVGGACDVFYVPKDIDDLVFFLCNKPKNLNTICLGNFSNVLISDAGIDGCVIFLASAFDNIEFFEQEVVVGAGVKLNYFINQCVEKGISCCEHLFSIPASIGGAVFMNAGVPNFEISNVLKSVLCLDQNGKRVSLDKKDINMQYRKGNIPSDFIIISATFHTSKKNIDELEELTKKIRKKRLETQPITQATCGSTFKNPMGNSAWKLILESGCSGLSVGDAAVSDMHCNFLVNNGAASASDFVKLIDMIKEKVLQKTNILLEEEVVVIGKK